MTVLVQTNTKRACESQPKRGSDGADRPAASAQVVPLPIAQLSEGEARAVGIDSLGTYLKRERELRQVSLEELVQTTRVPLKMLQRIEGDRFDELPGEVFARGFLRSYARALGLDAEQVLARFAEGHKAEEPPPAPMLASLQTPERGRRFGIAIALVILVILFTLALSIVLNARQRSTPLELSQVGFDAASAEGRSASA